MLARLSTGDAARGNRRDATRARAAWLLALLVTASIGALYADVVVRLWRDWWTDDNYGHGVLVPPAIAWLVWRRRSALAALTPEPSLAGALVVAASLALFLAGQAAFEFFLTRLSLVGVIAGSIVQLYGWRHLRAVRFPLVLLAIAIPLPAIVFNEIAFPLQLLASQIGVSLLTLAHVPALREGNVILLRYATLEVAEACSGVRSLISVITLALVYGQVARLRPLVHAALVASAVPVVVFANGLRVAGAGIAAERWGVTTATGFLHAFSGAFFFSGAILLMFGVERMAGALMRWVGVARESRE